jgi:hypothetical protein
MARRLATPVMTTVARPAAPTKPATRPARSTLAPRQTGLTRGRRNDTQGQFRSPAIRGALRNDDGCHSGNYPIPHYTLERHHHSERKHRQRLNVVAKPENHRNRKPSRRNRRLTAEIEPKPKEQPHLLNPQVQIHLPRIHSANPLSHRTAGFRWASPESHCKLGGVP